MGIRRILRWWSWCVLTLVAVDRVVRGARIVLANLILQVSIVILVIKGFLLVAIGHNFGAIAEQDNSSRASPKAAVMLVMLVKIQIIVVAALFGSVPPLAWGPHFGYERWC